MIGRRALALGLALGAAACANDDAATSSFRGTIAGEPFVPVDAAGFVMDAMPCARFGGGFGETPTATIVEVRFGDFAGVCDVAVETADCGAKASARTAYVAVARENVYGGAVPPIGPGTYGEQGTHVIDEGGVVQFLWMGLGSVDASCAPVRTGMYKEATGGSITFDEVSATRLRGHAEVSFDNGDVLSGSFDVPVCASSDEAQCAAMKGGCTSFTCVP